MQHLNDLTVSFGFYALNAASPEATSKMDTRTTALIGGQSVARDSNGYDIG